jgi:D-amino-acid dehydrogenase
MRILVVGGGVIGLCAAYSLRRAGAEVVVVERDRCGEATSLGNAGWVTPGLSAPLPAPGVVSQSLRWMAKPDSPLLIRPRLRGGFLLWCWHFARNCSPRRHRAGLEATLALNARTLELYDRMRAEGVEFEMHADGLVFAALSERELAHETEALDELNRAGYPGSIHAMTGEQVRQLEPALSDHVRGGFFAPAERHVRPESLMRGLAAALRRDGVEIVEGAGVESIERRNGAWNVRAGSNLVADRVVVCAGVWSRPLLARLGVRLPLEAAKGYSITAAVDGVRPRHPLYLLEAKLGCSPYDNGVRVAGTLELAGVELSLNQRRLDALSRAAAYYLREWRPKEPEFRWAGLRPLAPDGLPYIGRVPGAPGVYAATGHGMLGITLGPATGEALVPLVLEDVVPAELEPFRLDRGLARKASHFARQDRDRRAARACPRGVVGRARLPER